MQHAIILKSGIPIPFKEPFWDMVKYLNDEKDFVVVTHPKDPHVEEYKIVIRKDFIAMVDMVMEKGKIQKADTIIPFKGGIGGPSATRTN